MNANVAARVRRRLHRKIIGVKILSSFNYSIRSSIRIARASFCCRLLDDDDGDGFFKNHSSLFCKALTFSLLERRTDNGLTSYSLSLFFYHERTNKNILHSTQSILKRNQYTKHI